MDKINFKTKGVCSREINFTLEDGKVKNVMFTDGCNGNLSGIGKLVDGMKIDDVIEKLSGIKCGWKDTSCPDQLAKALIMTKNKK